MFKEPSISRNLSMGLSLVVIIVSCLSLFLIYSMQMKKIFLLLTLLCTSLLLQAQSAKIHGIVSDAEGNPVSDMTVFIPFTSKNTLTDKNGNYSLDKLGPGEVELIFRHLSYQPLSKTFNIQAGQSITHNVTVFESIVELDEII